MNLFRIVILCFFLISCQTATRNHLVPRDLKNLELVPLDSEAQTSFIVVGDTGTGDERQYKVADAITDWCDRAENQCEFVLLLGDNFYPSGVGSKIGQGDKQWENKVIQPYKKISTQIYPIMGNHDYAYLGRFFQSFNWGRIENQVMGMNELGPLKFTHKSNHGEQTYAKWYFPHQYYFISRGPLLLLGLDTPRLLFDKEHEQQHHLVKLMQNQYDLKPEGWRIGFGHHPMYSNGKHGNAGKYGENGGWVQRLFGEQKDGQHLADFFYGLDHNTVKPCEVFDVYFSGHDHNRQILKPKEGCPMVSVLSGAGGKLTKLQPNSSGAFDNPFIWQDDQQPGFTFVTATEDKMKIQMINVTGQVEVVVSCRKNTPTNQVECEKK